MAETLRKSGRPESRVPEKSGGSARESRELDSWRGGERGESLVASGAGGSGARGLVRRRFGGASGNLDEAASEGVSAPPTTGNAEKLEPLDVLWNGGVDEEAVADRFETEHGANEEKRSPSRPG